MLVEGAGEGLDLRVQVGRDELRAEQGLAQAVEDELGGADVGE
jgi:hypothetical protein